MIPLAARLPNKTGTFRSSRVDGLHEVGRLQELIAPVSVEFFSVEGQRLGNKYSPIQELHSITGINVEVLEGGSLDRLSVDERMSWVGHAGRSAKKTLHTH